MFTALVAATVMLVTVVPGTAAPAAPSAPAASGTPDPATAAARVDRARRQADALATKYFAALDRRATLDVQIHRLEAQLTRDDRRTRELRARVAVRAGELYMAGDTTVADYLSGIDPLENARRAHLVAAANAVDDAVFGELARETEGLRSRRRQLRADRQDQEGAIARLQSAQAAMDAQLSTAQRELAVARASAPPTKARPAVTAGATPGATRASPVGAPVSSGPIATPPLTPPSAGPPSGGGGSHHDDPYLVCTRTRESHGDYSVVNPAGPWYGAYQFSQSTWDAVANHVGRLDLVGVHPNVASVSDQDDMAWTLYQWQGKGPWGGLC